VAILPWSDLFHDFLDRLDVSFEDLRTRFTGSWMFGYAAALRTAGVDTAIVCPTTEVRSIVRTTHEPTGARLVLLPAGRVFSFLRAHARTDRLEGRRDPASIASAVAAHVGPYFGTPPLTLARALRRESCDVVLCQEYETPRFDVVVAVCRALGIPAYATFQGGDYQLSRIEPVLRPLSLRLSAGLVVGAAAEIDRLRERYDVPPEKIAQIFNPIDLSFWRPDPRADARAALDIPADASVVAWHGQVQIWRKGLDVLLRAWAAVTAARPERQLRLLLVGAGEDATQVRRMIDDQRLAGVAVLDGWRDRADVRRALSAADVYAFPSRHEGFPVAPIEAMACGLPVVATDAQGVRDIVADTGIVVARDDDPAFTEALAALVDDDDRRGLLAIAARERAEAQFSHDAVGSRLRDFLLGPSMPERPPG